MNNNIEYLKQIILTYKLTYHVYVTQIIAYKLRISKTNNINTNNTFIILTYICKINIACNFIIPKTNNLKY